MNINSFSGRKHLGELRRRGPLHRPSIHRHHCGNLWVFIDHVPAWQQEDLLYHQPPSKTCVQEMKGEGYIVNVSLCIDDDESTMTDIQTANEQQIVQGRLGCLSATLINIRTKPSYWKIAPMYRAFSIPHQILKIIYSTLWFSRYIKCQKWRMSTLPDCSLTHIWRDWQLMLHVPNETITIINTILVCHFSKLSIFQTAPSDQSVYFKFNNIFMCHLAVFTPKVSWHCSWVFSGNSVLFVRCNLSIFHNKCKFTSHLNDILTQCQQISIDF